MLRLRSRHLRWQKNPRGVVTPKGGGLHRPGPPKRNTLKEPRSREAHSRRKGETFWRDEAGLLGSNAPRSVQVQDGSQSFQDDQGPDGVKSSTRNGATVRRSGSARNIRKEAMQDRITAQEPGTGNSTRSIRFCPLKTEP